MFRLAAIFLMLGVTAANAAPPPGVSWDWQLSGKVQPPSVAVFDTDPDGDGVSRATIAGLKSAGVYTICYVSVGTVENYRDDAGAFPPGVVGKTYGDWPDEKFLDVRRADVLVPIMQARFERCKAFGFDAVEPDNMDVHENDSGFEISSADSVRYVSILAHMAHEMGLEIGQKNMSNLTPQLIDLMDFVITESCYQDGWCGEVSVYARRGKPIFDAEYTDRLIDFAKACAVAQDMSISMILKDRDLQAGGQNCNE